MPREYTYFRKYIILKKDYTNIENINPRGHAKLEVRGNRAVLNLNLDNCEQENYYRVYLLREINGRIEEEDLGRIFTDDRGRVRADIPLNLRELKSKGFPIDKTNAILIRRGISLLLAGYIDKDNKIIDSFIENLMEERLGSLPEEGIEIEDVEEVIEEAVEKIEEDVKEEIVDGVEEEAVDEEIIKEEVVEAKMEEEIIEEEEEEHKEEEIDDSNEQDQEEMVVQESTEPIMDFDSSHVDKGDIKEEIVEKIEEERIEEASYMSNYEELEYMRRLHHKKQMTNYILSVLRFFPQVQPLKIYLRNYTWWRIEDDGTQPYRGFLPYYNYLMSTDYKYPFLENATTCMEQISKYGHYLFGLYKEDGDVKLYVYGVPGRFTSEEHPFRGITGFNTWYDCVNGIGYWVLYIDPIKGKVIYPINPMVPSY